MALFNNSYSGLWDRQYNTPYDGGLNDTGAVGNNTKEFNATTKRRLAKLLKQKGNRPLARIVYALVGATSGGAAIETLNAVTAQAGVSGGANDLMSQGGVRPVGQQTLVNRVTTAADVTLIKDILTRAFGPTVNSGYPTDKAGVGGGGKIGAAGSGNYGF